MEEPAKFGGENVRDHSSRRLVSIQYISGAYLEEATNLCSCHRTVLDSYRDAGARTAVRRPLPARPPLQVVVDLVNVHRDKLIVAVVKAIGSKVQEFGLFDTMQKFRQDVV